MNNTGYSIYGPIEDASYEMEKQHFEVNLSKLNLKQGILFKQEFLQKQSY